EFEPFFDQKRLESLRLGWCDRDCVRIHLESRMKHLFIESTEFRSRLVAWYQRHARKLPWREAIDPYRILVSELMLQQTQVATVLGYYKRWLDRFPTIRALAEADEGSVLQAWEGLGYYRRARNLHQCAKIIVGRSDEQFPSTVEELRKLPGVGKYTAGGIFSFRFYCPAGRLGENITPLFPHPPNSPPA